MQKHGFTLIELLIVIAIIAILATILFPVFSLARENARRASCQSNLRQIGLAFQQYAQDYDDRTPGSSGNNGLISWPSQVFPYVKNDQMFTCPSAERVAIMPAGITPNTPTPRLYYGLSADGDGSTSGQLVFSGLSYGVNAITCPLTGTNTNWTTASFRTGNGPKSGFVTPGNNTTTGLKETSVGDSSGTIRVFDSWAGTATATNPPPMTVGNSIRAISTELRTDRFSNNEASKVAKRHFDGFNALYGDGHVKFKRWGTTQASEWSIQSDAPDGTPI